MECISYKKNNLLDINGCFDKKSISKTWQVQKEEDKDKKKANIEMCILPSMAVTHTSR